VCVFFYFGSQALPLSGIRQAGLEELRPAGPRLESASHAGSQEVQRMEINLIVDNWIYIQLKDINI
jgi:hypothetical protein